MKKSIILVLVCILFGQGLASDAATEALFRAIENNDIRAVNRALLKGAKVNAVYHSGETPLIMALHDERYDIVQRLIAGGANIDFECADGATALSTAIWFELEDFVRLFVELKAAIPKNLRKKDINYLDNIIKKINAERRKNLEIVLVHDQAVQNWHGTSVWQILRRISASANTEILPLASEVMDSELKNIQKQ